ncbi:L-valine transporter subunit YgaH [Acinetobacter bohemicus]|uniref:L-valine transporter subunit YgaH n=1 Tax=Acinetobacter TaxID=469 RepID=UPI00157DEF3F|nr:MULTISPECIES: L-valine transporter subunit YgaH [Acinetobacter]MCO8042992.1 L-valine transporter subunit YgaH [Acinetobacter sp. S4400-12]MCU7225320.1 L-valine transporter subunit YgaH [Acinetobacter bohemicus]MDM1781382.1 L-valine transporter subunit YgaH [Acinetobacter indicus]QKQ69626.1 L-valine transporter subunit YgaH [Acinetobacter sp. 10FS3-1]
MNLEIILVGILVGIANFASRFGPFFVIQKFQQGSQKRGALWLKIALGSIGIAAISSMLVVATLPPLLETPNKSFAMLIGFMVLSSLYFKFKKIVMATLIAALTYGLVYTYVPVSF